MLLLELSDWYLFVGRFHPILVHLPIGFLILVGLLEVGKWLGKITLTDDTLSFILYWSAVGASISCVAGYALSLGGGYEQELLSEHQWQGIGVAVLTWVIWWVKSHRAERYLPISGLLYLPLLLFTHLLTFVAGHHGGALTHGENYLSQHIPEPIRSWLAISIPAEEEALWVGLAEPEHALLYEDLVQPLLSARCTQCHNATKQKGNLRMDSFAYLTKGGENGPVFVKGNSAESELLKRCLLPLADDKHMPPKGKSQLTESQITLLSWWIDKGAVTSKRVEEVGIDDSIRPVLAEIKSSAAEGKTPRDDGLEKLSVGAPSSSALEKARKAGLLVMPIAQEKNLVEVSAVNAPNLTDAQLDVLSSLSEQIVWLKLGNTRLTDEGMQTITSLPNLRKLSLENTQITDKGVGKLLSLPQLHTLNLVGTKITEQSLAQLSEMLSLKTLYIGQTAISDSAVSLIQKKRKDLTLIGGLNEQRVVAFLQAGKKEDSLSVAPSRQ